MNTKTKNQIMEKFLNKPIMNKPRTKKMQVNNDEIIIENAKKININLNNN